MSEKTEQKPESVWDPSNPQDYSKWFESWKPDPEYAPYTKNQLDTKTQTKQ